MGLGLGLGRGLTSGCTLSGCFSSYADGILWDAQTGTYKMWVRKYGAGADPAFDIDRLTFMLEGKTLHQLLRAKPVAVRNLPVARDSCTMLLDPRAGISSDERFKAMCYSYGGPNWAGAYVSEDGLDWTRIKVELHGTGWPLPETLASVRPRKKASIVDPAEYGKLSDKTTFAYNPHLRKFV